VKKGDVLAVPGSPASRRPSATSDMIPLCHPLLVGAVNLNFEIGDDFIAVEANVDTVDRTGVEMEALHACAVAALTIYDMWQVGRPGHGDRRARAVGEARRALGRLPAARRTGHGDGNTTDVSDTVTNVVDRNPMRPAPSLLRQGDPFSIAHPSTTNTQKRRAR